MVAALGGVAAFVKETPTAHETDQVPLGLRLHSQREVTLF